MLPVGVPGRNPFREAERSFAVCSASANRASSRNFASASWCIRDFQLSSFGLDDSGAVELGLAKGSGGCVLEAFDVFR